jgi:hypothetical protein
MNLSKIAATGGIAGALSFAALGLGTGLAHADNDDQPLPPGPGWNGQGSGDPDTRGDGDPDGDDNGEEAVEVPTRTDAAARRAVPFVATFWPHLSVGYRPHVNYRDVFLLLDYGLGR